MVGACAGDGQADCHATTRHEDGDVSAGGGLDLASGEGEFAGPGIAREERLDGLEAERVGAEIGRFRIAEVAADVAQHEVENFRGVLRLTFGGQGLELVPGGLGGGLFTREQVGEFLEVTFGEGAGGGVEVGVDEGGEIQFGLVEAEARTDAGGKEDVCALLGEEGVAGVADGGDAGEGAIGAGGPDAEVEVASGEDLERSGAGDLDVAGEGRLPFVGGVARLARRNA